MVLFIDDWQWVDDATRQLLGSLMRGMREAPLLILTASRPVDPTGEVTDGVEILELAPFSVDESAQAIEALLPAGLDTDVASTIHERSGGNPLFLEELCQSLTDASETADSDLGVPATLHGLIEARVHRLPRAQAELVREAAVIGNVIPSWLFEQVSGYRQDDEILRQLASNDLIYAGETEGMFRFKHGITRDVVYQSIGLIQRRALHRRIAEILEKFRTVEGREEPYEALAYHYAGCADHLEASRYAELAGDRAMASAALDLARQQYAAALASLDQLEPTPERRRRWLAISTRRAFAGIFSPAPEQLEMLGQAAEYARELGDLDALGHARLWLGFVNVCMGEHKESIDQYQQGLRVAEEAGNAKLIAQFRANLGQSLAAACEYTEALALLDESIETKKRLQVGKRSGVAPTGSAFAIACKACVMGELGEFAQAHDLIDQALEAMRGSGNPVLGSIHGFHAIILLWQGRWEDCLETANRVRATGERINVPYLFGRRRSEAAYARFMLTGERDALEVLQQTSDWLDERRMRLYISLNYGCLTDAMTRVSEIDLARHYGQRALERAAQHDLVGEGMACRALARLAARESPAGEPSADRYLGMAMESARARNSKREIAITRFGQAELSAQRGRRREAEAFLDEARPEFQRMGMQWHETEAERLAEALGL